MQDVIAQLYKKFTFQPVLKNVNGKMKGTQWYAENKFGIDPETGLSWYQRIGLLGHPAIDMKAAIGTPSYAPVDGTVTAVVHDPYQDTKKGEWVEIASKSVKITRNPRNVA